MITIPNYDLVNYNNIATNDSVKPTTDEPILNKAVTNTSTTSSTTTKPTSIQPTTSITTEPYTKETESIANSTESVEYIVEESEYEQPEEIENNNTLNHNEETIYNEEYIYEDTNYDTLLDINNPNFEYTPAKIELSSAEREEIACIVMGEFGGGGFTGCALIAQCIRDSMDTYGYNGYNIRSNMQYYGYNPNPSSTAYEAVDWIFDGNATVQHRILVMNNSDGGWHSTQNFVTYYQGVWFYDMV